MGDAMDVDEPQNGSYRAQRRASMSEQEERQRRASIKAILADTSISAVERRRSIQHLMDGRRSSIGASSATSSTATGDSNPYGYGLATDANPYGYGDAEPQRTSRNEYGYEDPTICLPISNENTKRAELTRPRCAHYERNCSLVAPCCGAVFGCRICHDESPVLPPRLIAKQVQQAVGRRHPRSSSMPGSFTSMAPHMPEETHHTIDRFAVKEVICRLCYTKQSSKTNNCVNCGVQFGEYHCSTCNLWMSNDEKPYHCPDCGFCRVGGAENFQHCHDCGMCIDKSLYSNHNCKSGKYKSNCPVCQEYLFSSRSASHEMPCGHAIHWECFRQLAAHDSRCPVCKKTAETRERMMPTWNAMAIGVRMQAVPPELARVVNITCNDCGTSADAREWHFLGIQCQKCSSFNTSIDRIVMTGEEAHEFLEALRARAILNGTEEEGSRINRHRISRRRSLF